MFLKRVRTFKRLQALDTAPASSAWLHRALPQAALEDCRRAFLAPPRQHEGMDIQSVGHGLHFDAIELTQSTAWRLIQAAP